MMSGIEAYLTWKDYVEIIAFLAAWVYLRQTNRLPDIQSIKDLVDALNSRGGNLLALLFLTVYFFRWSMRIIFHALEMLRTNQLKADNAVLILGLTFVTSSAFGGAFAALLKTMSGQDSTTAGGGLLPPTPTNGNGLPAATPPATLPAAEPGP